jgi:hypothetical protein
VTVAEGIEVDLIFSETKVVSDVNNSSSEEDFQPEITG